MLGAERHKPASLPHGLLRQKAQHQYVMLRRRANCVYGHAEGDKLLI